MTSIERFEDLSVWKTSRELAKMIYQIKNGGDFSRDFGLCNQITRASVSVMSNIAEGFEHESQAHFISFLGRAKASAGDLRCQLYIAVDLKYITIKEFSDLSQKSQECSRQLFGFIRYLKSLPNTRLAEYTKSNE